MKIKLEYLVCLDVCKTGILFWVLTNIVMARDFHKLRIDVTHIIKLRKNKDEKSQHG